MRRRRAAPAGTLAQGIGPRCPQPAPDALELRARSFERIPQTRNLIRALPQEYGVAQDNRPGRGQVLHSAQLARQAPEYQGLLVASLSAAGGQVLVYGRHRTVGGEGRVGWIHP